MIKNKILCINILLIFLGTLCFAQTISSRSSIDWTDATFSSTVNLDVQKAGLEIPAGRSSANSYIDMQLPLLIKDALLSLPVNSMVNVGDLVLSNTLSLEELTEIIYDGKKSAGVFLNNKTELQVYHSLLVTDIASDLVTHKNAYMPAMPLDTVPSRPYTGIIIDARGSLPVHGEFVTDNAIPCFFPRIWDEQMNVLFERNMVEASIANKGRIAHYRTSSILSDHKDIIGEDPLFITARKVYGKNRTDPVISQTDALRILSVTENRELLTNGKVVILLDEDKLVQNIQVPEKGPAYYALYDTLVQRFYENKIDNIEIVDTYKGILISLDDIKFVPNSDQILSTESEDIQMIINSITAALPDVLFRVVVEGHTARIGPIEDEQSLSEARARTIMGMMTESGIPQDILSSTGYGGRVPRADNNNEEGRAQNRRVEITIIPEFTSVIWY